MIMSAARQRLYRERLMAGRRVARIEIDDVAVIEALIESNLLQPSDADDLEKVDAALGEFVAIAVRRYT